MIGCWAQMIYAARHQNYEVLQQLINNTENKLILSELIAQIPSLVFTSFSLLGGYKSLRKKI